MKKNIGFAIILVLPLCLISCKSTKQSKTEVEVTDGTKNVSSNDTETKKNYTGWLSINDSSGIVKSQIGSLKIEAMKKYGTFNIYAINERKKEISLFSTVEEFISTSFYLLAGKKVYKLTEGSGITSIVRVTENGIRIIYTVKNVAEVLVDFTIFKSDSKHDADMIKVTSTVKSLTKKNEIFALRVVLDTVLGEHNKFPFYDSDNLPINSETMFSDSKKPKWILSKDDYTSLQVLLQGADISPVDFVTLANYETLSTFTWTPNMTLKKNFNTVRSYNNSAIGINWPEKELPSGDKTSYIFYMAVATDSAFPNGMAFVNGTPAKEVESDVVDVRSVSQNVESSDSSGSVIPTVIQNDVPNVVSNIPISPESSNNVKKNPDYVDFDVKNIPKEKLSQEYIQKLLKRIANLEEDDPNLNNEELLMLNKELDIILDQLRKQ